MKPSIKKKWIAALLSGDYKQGRNALCSVNEKGDKKFCCLGVLTDLYIKEHKYKWKGEDSVNLNYKGNENNLIGAVQKWAGIHSSLANISELIVCKHNEYDNLAELNDAGKTFKQIAKIIEKEF